MSAAAEAMADWLVDQMRGEDGTTLVWRKDGKTIVYFDFETPSVFLVQIAEAEVVPASNDTRPE